MVLNMKFQILEIPSKDNCFKMRAMPHGKFALDIFCPSWDSIP